MEEESRYMVQVIGFSSEARWADVYQFFSNCGSIKNLEILRTSEDASIAIIAFEEAYSVEIALCLSGSEIAGQKVLIFSTGTYHVDPSPHLLNFDEAERNSVALHSDNFVSSPGEAITVVQEAVQTMISKGYVLSKDALSKAKAFDESRHLSSTAAAKMFELSKKIGLTDKINSGIETVKSVDDKYQVSQTTISVASYTGKTAAAAATAVVNSSYFAKGALWVSGALDRAAKATAKLGEKGIKE